MNQCQQVGEIKRGSLIFVIKHIARFIDDAPDAVIGWRKINGGFLNIGKIRGIRAFDRFIAFARVVVLFANRITTATDKPVRIANIRIRKMNHAPSSGMLSISTNVMPMPQR
ncbi:hypothetical protein U14_01258 [Candidatus Moduliflexus flocculans]|uniref:Uncharacterized protein n=1 Tax=Candidatus Moduliflexus flocculans TaxID=1499966 RepID=A0A0S6VX34_9BACT|nr:hypothetical protein U14_01258 [Candidatus Moduliflexus flocculans]